MKRLNIGVFLNIVDGNYYEMIWKGLVQEAQKEDINLIFYIGKGFNPHYSWNFNHTYIYELSKNNDLDGLIVNASISYTLNDDFRNQLRNWNIPIITMGDKIEGIPNITSDTQGIKETIRYLVSHGRDRIAFITGNLFSDDAKERLETYRQGLIEAGIPIDEKLIEEGMYTPRSGVEAALRLQKKLNNKEIKPFNALIASNDDMAFGAMSVFKDNGLCVPGDIAVIGFDDTIDGMLSIPSLSSVSPQIVQQSEFAVREILHMIRNKMAGCDHTLPSKLIPRETLAAEFKTMPSRSEIDFRKRLVDTHNSIDSMRDLTHYINVNYNLEESLQALIRFLPQATGLRYCRIALFDEPIINPEDVRKKKCRFVMNLLSAQNKPDEVNVKAELVPPEKIPPEILSGRGNYIYMPLVYNELKFGFIIFEFSILTSTFVYELLHSQISIALKSMLDYNRLKKESEEKTKVYEENLKVQKAMSLMEESQRLAFRSIVHTFKNKHAVHQLLYEEIQKDTSNISSIAGDIDKALDKPEQRELADKAKEIFQNFQSDSVNFFRHLEDMFDYIYAVIQFQLGESILSKSNISSNLDKICHHLIQSYKNQMNQFNIHFEYINRTSKEILLPVYDFILEDDVFRNLLTNSIRAHIEADPNNQKDDKKIWIEVYEDLLRDQSGTYRIHFKDNGPGIPDDKKIIIFDGYSTKNREIYQPSDPELRVSHGVGGRTIKRRIEEAGGTIVEAGKFGQGADFIISLPKFDAQIASGIDPTRTSRKKQNPEGNASNKCILIIEDNPEFSDYLAAQFQEYHTRNASGVKEALAVLKEFQPDLITLDLDLKDDSGLNFIKEFKKTGSKTPIIVISSKSREHLPELKELGVTAAFTKPANMEIVIKKITETLNKMTK